MCLAAADKGSQLSPCSLDFTYNSFKQKLLYASNSKPLLSCEMDSQHEQDHHPHQPSHFIKSLQELKDLHSQLRSAADYWEKTFVNAKQKKKVVESTKEYVCRAVVATVDHLGSVSVSLNATISDKATVFSGAELRIDSLKQRLLAYELYAHKIALTRTRWCPALPKLHRCYMSTPIDMEARCSPDAPKVRDNKVALDAEELPLFLYTYSHRVASSNNPNFSIVPVGDTTTVCGRGQKAVFHFQQNNCEQKKKHGRRRWSGGRSSSSGDIMSLVRRSRRPS